MAYHPFERRRRRTYRSSSSLEISSARDDEEIEREIIERAMEIERSREKSLRRQFEYIVQNVKELERRRRHQPHSRRFYQSNDSSSYSEIRHHRSSSTAQLKRGVYCQVTMTYHGNGKKKYGDEIMLMQENLIVFKGFLRAKENFTFKFKRRLHHFRVKLDCFINELFECSLPIDCEQKRLDEENDFFELIELQYSQPNQQLADRKEAPQIANGVSETNRSRRHRHSHSSSSSTIDAESERQQQQQKSKPVLIQTPQERRKVPRESASTHQPTQRTSSSPPPIRQRPKSNAPATTSPPSQPARSKVPSTKEKSSDDEDELTLKEPAPTKPNYGPPQVSTFARSSSESSSDENAHTALEIAKPSDISPAKKDEQEEEEESGENPSGFVGFLQLLNAMSGGAVRVPSGNDDGDGIQGLLTRLGLVTQSSSRKRSLNWTPHQTGCVENFLLVYLNNSPPAPSLLSQFLSLTNSFKSFDDCDDCIAFINTVSNEQVLLIVNDTLGDPVVSRIQDLQQLVFIYVLCDTEEQMENWSSNQPKIRGIYTDIQEIFEQMRADLGNEEENCLALTYAFPNSNAKEEPLFAVQQIVKEILLDQDETNDGKEELLDFARREYEENLHQLKFIQAFEEHYQKENVLRFYQKDQFIYKMLNKSFRVPEVDILFKLRLFIQHLHYLIVSSSNHSSLKSIYRKQFLSHEQVETLKKSVDGTLISFSNFFLASPRRPDWPGKASADDENNLGEEVLFDIDVSGSQELMPVNGEILVTFALVTRFLSFEKDKHSRTIVHLKTVSRNDPQLERIVEPIRKETRAPYPALRLIKLLIELEEFAHAVYLGDFLLTQVPTARKDPLLALARLYHSLGTTLYEKEEYDQALDVIKKSHEIYLRFLPEDAPQLSPTWNNMGSIYLRQGRTELALEHHEKALAIQLKSPSPDLPSIISYSNNIGGVYMKLEKYDDALVHFKRALQIEEQTLPKNHPELAGTYHRIGGVYFRQNNYEKALENYDRTLEIELASLSATHPTVAVTYHNRATALEGLGKLDEAVQSAEQAVERLLKTLPKEHSQVRMNQAYVDKLKQKLWVKQLFTS